MLVMDIKNVAIIGAGMMGKMLSFVFAAQYDVSVFDTNDIDVIAGIREGTKELIAKGLLTQNEFEKRISRIKFTSDIKDEGIAAAELLVEAIPEDMALKQSVFEKLEDICRQDCIFCTNTSVMSPSEISRNMRHRGRFCATHFWNPPHLIPLVEVVMSDATKPEVAQVVIDVLTGVGKKAVLCKKDVPGFIANRLQHALWREAFYMVQEGIADAKTVDDACKFGPGLRWPQLGPMENSDLVGIDLTLNIHNYILKHLADNHSPSPLLYEMLESGNLRTKSGEGWQKWSPEQIEALSSELREYLIDRQ